MSISTLLSFSILFKSGGIAIVCFVGFALWKLIPFVLRVQQKDEPPVIRGNLVFGSAVDFSRDAMGTMRAAAQKYGPVFTLRLLNIWVTIIADVQSVKDFRDNPDLSLSEIVKKTSRNLYQFSFKNHDKMMNSSAKALSSVAFLRQNMEVFTKYLNDALEAKRIQNKGKMIRLKEFLDETLFVAVFESIYGRWPQETGFTPNRFKQNMDIIQVYLQYLWFGLPHRLFPKANRAIKELQKQPTPAEILAKTQVSDFIKAGIMCLRNDGQPESDIAGYIIGNVHVMKHIILLAFWTIYLIITHPLALRELQKEIDAFIDGCSKPGRNTARISMKELMNAENGGKLQLLESCINEAARYSSGVFTVRSAVKETEIRAGERKWRIRKGDNVAIFAPLFHLDDAIFTRPHEFVFYRFAKDTIYAQNGKTLPEAPLFLFGTRCPAKHISLLRLRWLLIELLTNYSIEANCGEERAELNTKYYGIELLPPTFDPLINICPRRQITLQLVD